MSIVRSLKVRTALVVLVVVVLGGLTLGGCLGPAVGDERIVSYDVVAVVREDRTVAVREVIDYDFGGESRRGIFRTIPASGGVPTDIEVTSPDAPTGAQVTTVGAVTEVRVGDPDRTTTGRHRYVLTYVLPNTISDDRFALNVIGTELEVGSERATVTILGADLADRRCFTGGYGSEDRCEVTAGDDGAYRVVVDDLGDHEGITVDGDLVATRAASPPEPPAFVDRDGSARASWTAVVLGLGTVAAAATFLVCRQVGRNAVAGGGATEAAFPADGRFGPTHATPTEPPPGATLVADTDMADLAGLEFVPPRGIEPWQAAVVLRETIDARTVGAWFSGLAAHDVVTFDRSIDGATTTLRPGPAAASADATVAPILNQALGGRSEVELGTYDPRFATAWRDAGRAIGAWTVGAGVFRRRPPRFSGSTGSTSPVAWVAPVVFLAVAGGGGLLSGARSAFAAVAVGVLVPLVAALVAYRPLTRSLSVTGSAIALRSESFRRFLHDSEAQHVEWAWQNGVLREYSAWAVALGEADAWNGALAASSVPPVEVTATSGILYPAIYGPSLSSTTTAPSSSGGGSGGGGGGFSGGGFSGGGGGGGGGGSW